MSIDQALPLIFMAILGLAMLAYVLLDGYDLGTGMLMIGATPAERDVMLSSIGPFWDANETWLVLGVGLMLIVFPKAQALVFGGLYLPIVLMLAGLILRGAAFDFRIKAQDAHKPLWNRAFIAGSILASCAQGWMLGRYITGFAEGTTFTLFAALIALALPAAYVLLGAGWLIMKTDGALQEKAIVWARRAWLPMLVGMLLISLATPWVSASVRDKWFAMPAFIALLPIPISTAAALFAIPMALRRPSARGHLCWLPFALTVLVFLLGFCGLAYSLYPFVVMDQIDVWQAAASPEALKVILFGTTITLPAIIGYTIFVYRIFHGKAVLHT